MSTPIEDRCAFGSWCPKKTHARLWCIANATGSVVGSDGKTFRLCAAHGPAFARWGRSDFAPDNQPVVTTGDLAL